jgi:hypothetical protein
MLAGSVLSVQEGQHGLDLGAYAGKKPYQPWPATGSTSASIGTERAELLRAVLLDAEYGKVSSVQYRGQYPLPKDTLYHVHRYGRA